MVASLTGSPAAGRRGKEVITLFTLFILSCSEYIVTATFNGERNFKVN